MDDGAGGTPLLRRPGQDAAPLISAPQQDVTAPLQDVDAPFVPDGQDVTTPRQDVVAPLAPDGYSSPERRLTIG
jgi:hypothetical protein